MSLFRSMMAGYDDALVRNHMRRMDQMMDSMMMPFDSMFQMPGQRAFPPAMHASAMNSLMPAFPSFGQSLFPAFDQMFNNIQSMANDPNCHSYSSSSVTTYTMDGNGQPQIYQATSSTQSAPGGIKETRKTVRNSKTGEQHMSIGHHIHEKAHIVEKSRNSMTGQREETEEFINIDEDDAEDFNKEWVNKTKKRLRAGEAVADDDDDDSIEIIEVPQPLAITAGPSQSSRPVRSHNHSRKRDKANASSSSSSKVPGTSSNQKKSKYSNLPRYESDI